MATHIPEHLVSADTKARIRPRKLEQTVAILKAVAHPVRFQIVVVLLSGERSVGDLVDTTGIKHGQISQQLAVLKMTGILRSKRQGNRVFYSIRNKAAKEIVQSIVDKL